MEQVMRETKISQHVTEHDIRAKAASDDETLEQPQALLSHAVSKTTKRLSPKPVR
jgi:hypothetical protein